MVRWICHRGDRDWRPGARRDHEHRRGQSFHPQFLESLINLGVTALGEARVAKMTSLAVVAGALLFILFSANPIRSICNCLVAFGFCKLCLR